MSNLNKLNLVLMKLLNLGDIIIFLLLISIKIKSRNRSAKVRKESQKKILSL